MRSTPSATLLPALLLGLLGSTPAAAQEPFVHFETPHVSPLALMPDGTRLLAVNTPDAQLEVFDVVAGTLVHRGSVPVGLDPVSVRIRSANEAWVVNHVSDSISIVDLSSFSVTATLQTNDEPADVVFTQSPERAFVSCAQTDEVLVFDPDALNQPPVVIDIEGEEPRALAVNAAGDQVYVAVFESGNRSTLLSGGLENNMTLALQNVVSDPLGPYSGQNPPPNQGNQFVPALNPSNPVPPRVGLIVKKDAQGAWRDDNNRDWTDLVSGPNAARSDRPVGWDVLDNDLAVIDAATLNVSYVEGLMNICMALAVHPTTGDVSVVGTDGTNEVRFEPNLNGVFLRVNHALANPVTGTSTTTDLNPQLDYTLATLPQSTRDLAVGDPRGVVWNAAGNRMYVSGMGSNNVVVSDASGARVGTPIEVGEGPTGLALDDASGRLFVLNKFDASISVVDLASMSEQARVPFHDSSPEAIQVGRRHLYSTHETSGTGHVACASCHVDARMDRLAWDLGNPSGDVASLIGRNLGANIPGLNTGFDNYHPMKGPMATQTLQDIIGKEPLHWRGDRLGIEEFNPAFVELQGDDTELSATEMQEFKDFLATLYFQPNPKRNFDNSLQSSMDLDGLVSSGRFSPAGTPMPAGNAVIGQNRYIASTIDGVFRCVTCHTLPTGMGPDLRFQGGQYVDIPAGPNGERHHAIVAVDGSTQHNIKIPQTRNILEKEGFSLTSTTSRAGFGVLHDGSIPGIVSFLSSPAFSFGSDQDLANVIAFVLSLNGSEFPAGSTNNVFFPPGTASQDVHAGVGAQTTLVDITTAPGNQTALLFDMLSEASQGRVGLIVKGLVNGEPRGYAHLGDPAHTFQSDRAGETLSSTDLFLAAAPGSELTWTVVPIQTELRLGVDRDGDSFFDGDERDAGSDPADPLSVPDLGSRYCDPAVANSTGAPARLIVSGNLSAAANDLVLVAEDLPPSQFGYFLNSPLQGLVVGPGSSQGNLCLSGGIGRYNAPGQVLNSGASGRFSLTLDLSNTPTPGGPVAATANQTWNFQGWYRDVNPSATSNFTDAVSVVLQ